jgi:outer membrane immunogenic protein
MKKIAYSLVTVLVLSGTGIAGGDIAPVTPILTNSWSGFYVGFQAGGVWGDSDVVYEDNQHNRFYAQNIRPDGFLGGFYGGYNWIVGDNWLFGVEGEWNYISADDTVNIDGDPQTTAKLEQEWDASIRLRLGKVLGEYLPYITGGVAWSNFDLKTHDAYSSNPDISTSYTLTGWTIGGGLEMRLTDNLLARVQYRYTDYGNDTKRIWSNGSDYFDARVKYNTHMVTVGISYRF